jgi:peptidyl-prolyl cis-trans isomerase SurA
MTWRARLAWVWVGMTLTACGCLSKGSDLAALPSPPPTAAGTIPSKEVVRSQKPESADLTVCRLINLPVARPAEAVHGAPSATIRAVVNDELILDEELQMSCAAQMMAARTPKEREEVVRQALEVLIDREVVLQDAIAKLQRGGKQGEAFLKMIHKLADEEFDKRWLRPMLKEKKLASRADLDALMQQAHISLEVMQRWWVRNYMAQQYLSSRIEPHINRIGHREITEYYNDHRDEYTQPDRVEWQDIFIDATRYASRGDARQFCESLVQRVRQGEDFAKLSVDFDNGESGHYRKGAGQGNKRGEIFPHEAERPLFQMKDGDIEIVDCPRGFHIVRLLQRQYAGPIPFDAKVQKEIRDKLRMVVFLREKESIVKDLKRKSVIDRCEKP